jgi:hypothetical protein
MGKWNGKGIHYSSQEELEESIVKFENSKMNEDDYLSLFLDVARAFGHGVGIGGEQITNAIKNAIAKRNLK